MKSPSKNVSRSLRGQRAPGRAQEPISTSSQTRGGSMIVPGEGKVEVPPGRERANSAAEYGNPLGRKVGG